MEAVGLASQLDLGLPGAIVPARSDRLLEMPNAAMQRPIDPHTAAFETIGYGRNWAAVAIGVDRDEHPVTSDLATVALDDIAAPLADEELGVPGWQDVLA